LVVKPWPPELSIEEVDLSTCVFWLQVHGLPLQNLTAVNAIRIGKFIGDVKNVENGDCLGIIAFHHLHIRIEINVLQPLIPGFYLPRDGLAPIWIKFQYECLVDYCVLCGLIGHQRNFCPKPGSPEHQARYTHTLRGYVYPGNRFPKPPPAQVSASKLLCTEDLGLLFHSPMDVACGGQLSPPLLLESVTMGRLVDCSSFIHGLPNRRAATSHHHSADMCKGKDKIFTQQDFLEPVVGQPSSSPEYPLGFEHHNLTHFSMGPTITGPIIHRSTDQHSHSGHLQLAQQLTGVMGHSSSGLTGSDPTDDLKIGIWFYT